MSKLFKHTAFRGLHYILIISLVCVPFTGIACDDCFCECYDKEEFVNYHELEEYEDIYREFEIQAELEEMDLEENAAIMAKGFFGWGKKLKRWFKKRTVQLLKKCINFKKYKDPDACAYTVAKFKRKIDGIYKTGDIEDMLDEFDRNLPKGKKIDSFEAFKDRIRYYHHNKKEKPQHPDHDRYNQCINMSKGKSESHKKNDLDKYPVRAVIGGVEIACGCLIFVLPFPGCKWLGRAIIGHGTLNIAEAYTREWEKEDENKKKNSFVPHSALEKGGQMEISGVAISAIG